MEKKQVSTPEENKNSIFALTLKAGDLPKFLIQLHNRVIEAISDTAHFRQDVRLFRMNLYEYISILRHHRKLALKYWLLEIKTVILFQH